MAQLQLQMNENLFVRDPIQLNYIPLLISIPSTLFINPALTNKTHKFTQQIYRIKIYLKNL
jgi:hypothetical protein